jgi:hypothetical protein
MNPTLLLILQKNSADIEAIINKVGIGVLLSLMPQILAITATATEAQSSAPKTP